MKAVFYLIVTGITLLLLLIVSSQIDKKDPKAINLGCKPMLNISCDLMSDSSISIKAQLESYPVKVEESNLLTLIANKSFSVKTAYLLGVDMNMGRIPIAVTQINDIQTQLEIIPASCVNPNMQWLVQLLVQYDQQTMPLELTFTPQN